MAPLFGRGARVVTVAHGGPSGGRIGAKSEKHEYGGDKA